MIRMIRGICGDMHHFVLEGTNQCPSKDIPIFLNTVLKACTVERLPDSVAIQHDVGEEVPVSGIHLSQRPVAVHLGNEEILSPALAAWIGPIVFFALGATLWRGMRS